MKKICILGSTGSIGKQTLEVVRQNPDDFEVLGLTCSTNISLLFEQVKEFRPRVVAVEETVVDVGMFIGSVETVHPTDDLLLPSFVGFHHPGGFAVPYRKGHDLSFF